MDKYLQKFVIQDKNHIKNLCLVGVICSPLYYLTWVYLFPQRYESLTMRCIALLATAFILIEKRWPKILQRYFLSIFTSVLIFCGPLGHWYMGLKNEMNSVWLSTNAFMPFFTAFFFCNSIMFVASLLFSIVLASTFYYFEVGNLEPLISHASCLPVYLFSVLLSVILTNSIRKYYLAQVANEQLNLLNSNIKTYAGSIAHELKNPLSNVTIATGLLQSLVSKTALSADQLVRAREIVDIAQINCQRSTMIINMILKNIRNEKIDTASFRIFSALDVVKLAVKEYAFNGDEERSKVLITGSNDFSFYGSEDLLLFVLFNLLKNSLYYVSNQPNGKVEIWLTEEQHRNCIYVWDNGPGIPTDKLTGIFESFFTSGKKEGTGLGLAFCRQVMQSFHGNITCESQHGHWTRFCLEFPKNL